MPTNGAPLPSPISPTAITRRVLCIPGMPDEQYYSLVKGLIIQGTYNYFWDESAPYEDKQEVIQIWRTMFNAMLNDEDCMDFCAEVLECVLTNDTLNEAIRELGGGGITTAPVLRKNAEGFFDDVLDFSDGEGGCDKDSLFGAISNFITVLDGNNLDFFDLMEIQTNVVELIGIAGQILPVSAVTLGLVQTISSLIDQFFSVAQETYIAQWTDELYDKIRCDIFCLAQDGCSLSLDLVYDYFDSKLGGFLGNEATYLDILQAGWQVFVTETDIVYAMMLFQLALSKTADTGILQWVSAVYGNNSGRLRTQMLAGANNPDADWSILCTDCTQIPKTLVVYGRGYRINGGTDVVVNPTTDGFYTIDCYLDDEITLVCNGSAVAVGNCATSATQTVTITYLSIASGEVANFRTNGTCAIATTFTVGDTLTDGQAEVYGLSAMAFIVIA